MVITIVVVISRVACLCIRWLYPESYGLTVVDLFFAGSGFPELLGVLLVLISAAVAAGRAVLEELIMLEEKLLSPLFFRHLALVFCWPSPVSPPCSAEILLFPIRSAVARVSRIPAAPSSSVHPNKLDGSISVN